ncbi:MAG: SBBP repeat-containing protein, partial [Nitrospirae bacterium]|nr:SBBP repeat-containing protein [Nitrospirota bacterium]
MRRFNTAISILLCSMTIFQPLFEAVSYASKQREFFRRSPAFEYSLKHTDAPTPAGLPTTKASEALIKEIPSTVSRPLPALNFKAGSPIQIIPTTRTESVDLHNLFPSFLSSDIGPSSPSENHNSPLAPSYLKSGEGITDGVKRTLAKMPLRFIENRGQLDSKVKYYARSGNSTVFFTDKEIVFDLKKVGHIEEFRDSKIPPHLPLDKGRENTPLRKRGAGGDLSGNNSGNANDNGDLKSQKEIQRHVVRMKLEDSNLKPVLGGKEKLSGTVNYFIGKDPSKWRTDVPTFGEVYYKDVYAGIDMRFYAATGGMEYDFIVHPGADPEKIKLAFEGADGIDVGNSGDLVVKTSIGDLLHRAPHIYQIVEGKKVEVSGKYEVAQGDTEPVSKTAVVAPGLSFPLVGNPSEERLRTSRSDRLGAAAVSFKLASYDKSKPLVIDPFLEYSTYLGGNGDDAGFGITIDASGNSYVTGYTLSTDFPTASALQGSNAGVYDVFVTKINSDGSGPVYSTYLGGADHDEGAGIKVDSSGNAYITGYTASSDFPTASALQGTKTGGFDAFITQINAAGNGLVYSTYLGGTGDDGGSAIALDTAENAYITGYTHSADFPTASPLYGAFAGVSDAFITKIDASGSALVYSTYIGGTGDDEADGITVDASGNAYITGITDSTDFPTASALQGTNSGGFDAFITQINAAGNGLVYSTYIGGAGDDWGSAIALDIAENAYITGNTNSTDFPTASALQVANAGMIDAFIIKITAGGSLVYSTYLGGAGDDIASSIAIDTSGIAFIIGRTSSSTDFPITSALYASYSGGANDAFITKINASGSGLDYSTYIGGTGDDWGIAIALDSAGTVYVTGIADSSDFPTVLPLYGHAVGYDVFVAKISNLTLTISKNGTGTGTVTSDIGGINCGATCSASYNPSDLVTLTATSNSGSTFVGWSGDCSGNSQTCQVTMDAVKNVTARFNLPTPKCGIILSNTTWDLANSPYSVTCDVAVAANVTLTIEAGTIIKFAPVTSLTITDTLNANGQVNNRIYFTSIKDDSVGGDTNGDGTATTPAAGDWAYIHNQSGTTNLNNCVMRYGGAAAGMVWTGSSNALTITNSTLQYSGQYGVWLDSATGTNTLTGNTISNTANHGVFIYNNGSAAILSNNTITNNGAGSYGIYMTGTSQPLMSGTHTFGNNGWGFMGFDPNAAQAASDYDALTFVNVPINAVLVYPGALTLDSRWSSNRVYHVTGTLTVNAGKQLRVDANSIVKFADGTNLLVYGTLLADGNTSNAKYGTTGPVYFTNYRDDSVGGDTNGDGSTSPAGLWYIYNYDPGTTNLNNCVIRYGGGGSGLISTSSSNPLTLTNSTLQYSNRNGVYVNGTTGANTLTGNTISNTGWHGIYLNNNAGAATISGNTITGAGNTFAGIYVSSSSASSPTIQNNSIHNNTSYGIYLTGATTTPNIYQNFIYSNPVGIYATSSANPLIGGSAVNSNNIYNNTTWSVQNATAASPPMINAQYNYWGSAAGPYHASTNTGGNVNSKVTDNVDYGNYPSGSLLPVDLGITKSGSGTGTVRSQVTGINCDLSNTDCSETYTPGSLVTLHAIPATGTYFNGWSADACVGNVSLACLVTMDAAKTVNAAFTTTPPTVQTWAKTYGGIGFDDSYSVQQTSDGGYIVAGHSEINDAGGDIWVFRLDAAGEIQQQKTYGAAGTYDASFSVQQTSDGGHIVAGEAYVTNNSIDFRLLKLNGDGSMAWAKTYGGTSSDFSHSIQQTSDGGYIVAGETNSFGSTAPWILKLNISGTDEWQKRYGGDGPENASVYSIQQTLDGGYIAAGYTSISSSDSLIFKLNSDGSTDWVWTYAMTGFEYINSIVQTSDGGYIAAGTFLSSGSGPRETLIIKLNSDGSTDWMNTYGDGATGDEEARVIQQTIDGGYIVAGDTSSFGSGGTDAWVFKLNNDGSVAWEKTYGGTGDDYARSVHQTADSGYILAGSTTSYGPGIDSWVLKLDASGDITGCPGGLITTTAATVVAMTATETGTTLTVTDTSILPTSGLTETDTSITPGGVCPVPPSLTVLKSGTGDGLITGDLGGINCGATCSDIYILNDVVTLSVSPAPGSTFTGWSGGGCSGIGTCVVTVSGEITVTAAFNDPLVIMKEPFTSGLPAGWTLVDNAGNGGWRFDDPGARGNLTGGSGTFAIADSGNLCAYMDAELISPSYDLSTLSNATLEFRTDFYSGSETADVDISTDGGTNWTNVWKKTADYPGPATETINISSPAAGQADVKIRFHYYDANCTWWWQVDDVKLYTSPPTVLLTVTKSDGGTGGSGTVRSQVSGIDCGGDCTETYPMGSVVTLQAVPDTGSYFNGWTNGCVSLSLTCMVTMDAAKTVSADFTTTPPAVLTWAKTYGGIANDAAYSIESTADGGYLVSGTTSSFGAGSNDVWAQKLSADGSIVWQKTYGGAGVDMSYAVKQTADGGYVMAGKTTSFSAGGYDVWVLKLNADSTVAWEKTFGGTGTDEAYSVAQTADGGYVVAAFSMSFGSGNGDAWVLKLNADGSLAWQKTFGGASTDKASFIDQTADGGYVVAGNTYSFDLGNGDAWVLKLNADGTVAWEKTFGGATDDERSYTVHQTVDGGYMVAGYTYLASSGLTRSEAWALKLNADGTPAWQKTVSGAQFLEQTYDGGYVVAGITGATDAADYDSWVLKIDAGGTIVWQKTYGGAGYDAPNSLQQTADGGYVLAGTTRSFGLGAPFPAGADAWVLKLNSDGDLLGCPGGMIGTKAATVTDTTPSSADSAATIIVPAVTPADSTAAVADTNVTPGGVCTGIAVPEVPIENAADNNSLIWTTGGDANWFGQTFVTHDGIDAAQSGVIGDSLSTWMTTTVTGPATFSFWWKVSSEDTYDYLRVYIDGTEQAAITGEVDWQKKYYSIPAGAHTIRWEYSKDSSAFSGSDAGWVDQVEICYGSYDVLPAYPQTGFGGGPGLVNVNAVSGSCGWTAVSESPWITITGGASGAGSGAVNYSVDPGPQLLGMMNIADEKVRVTRTGTGGLDTTFNAPQGYIRSMGTFTGVSVITASAVQTDGKLVVAGYTYTSDGIDNDLLVARVNADGSMDTSFNTTGVFIYNGTVDGWDRANAVALQSDGGIVIAGSANNGTDIIIARLTSAGLLDAAFATNGVFTYTASGIGANSANAVAIQSPGGEIVVAGGINNSGAYDVLVSRLTSTGMPDATFGTNGVVTYNWSANNNNQANAVALQSDGGIVIAGRIDNSTNDDILVSRLTSTGLLDTTFGTNGIYTYNGPENGWDRANAVTIQSDGGIVFAGSIPITGTILTYDILVSRLTSTGLLDTTFGTNGMFTFDGGVSLSEYANAIAFQPDGKIVVAGNAENGTTGDALVLRLATDGSLDATFGYSGVASFTPFANSNSYASTVAIGSDGKLVVAGYTNDGISDIGFVLRLTATGTVPPTVVGTSPANGAANVPVNTTITATFSEDMDPATINGATFVVDGVTGAVTYDVPAKTAAFTPDAVLAGGTTYTARITAGAQDLAGNALAAAHAWTFTTSNTVPDTTFNGTGMVVHHNAAGGNDYDLGNSITVDTSGRILVTGYSLNASGNFDMVIWRHNADGSMDTTFNSAGAVPGILVHDSATGGNSDDFGNSITTDATGRILVAGYSYNASGNYDMVIWRYNADGSMDTTFNSAGAVPGIVVHDSAAGGNSDDFGNSITVDTSGRILVTGYSINASGNYDMVIWRYNADSSMDTTFNSAGAVPGIVVHESAAGGNDGDYGWSITTDAADRILVAGYSFNASGNDDMVIWRYNPDGTLDTTFNNSGFVIHSNAAGGNSHDWGSSITIDASGRIFVTGSSVNASGDDDMVIWRYNADGTLDTTFNGTGLIVHNNAAGGNSSDAGYSITVDGLGRILVTGWSNNAAGNDDMVVWRYNDDGTLDTTFGNAGIIVSHNAAGGNSYDVGYSITVDASGRILVTGESGNAAGNSDMVIWAYKESYSVLPGAPVVTDFSSGLPAGWTVKDNTGNGVWRFDDPGGRGNQTGGTGGFAIADALFYSTGLMDTELISPVYDISALAGTVIGFKSRYIQASGTANLDISLDGGTTWYTILSDPGSGPGTLATYSGFLIPGGQPTLRIRFHFTGTDWWQIDDVQIFEAPVLTVSKSGTGTGTVRSQVTGIDCGPDCTEAYIENTVVTLKAIPDSGSYFNGWSGDACVGNVSLTCMVTMDAAKSVNADFTTTAPVVQTWAKTYGEADTDGAEFIQQTSDGGYIVAGSRYSAASNWDFWILKLNGDGSTAWQKTYGDAGAEEPYSIQQTADGGYIVAGYTNSYGTGGDAWVLKLFSDGTPDWQKSYGDAGVDQAYYIQQTADGGYIVAGYTESYGAGGDVWILKLNSDGSTAWQKSYGGTGYEEPSSIQQTADGGYIVAGNTASYGAGRDAWILKLNSDGTADWQKTYGGSGYEEPSSIQQTADGGYIVAGTTDSYGGGNYDTWILKLNSDGSTAWQKTYGETGYEEASSIQQTTDGGYIVAGTTDSHGIGGEAWILKLFSDGTSDWQKTYGENGYELPGSIRQTADGGYIVASYTDSYGAGGDAWILKLDSNGDILSCPGEMIGTSNAIATDTFVTDADTAATISDTSVTPADSTATVMDTLVTPGGVCSGVATAVAPLPLTGQSICFDEAGLVTDCTDTGQDGHIQAGVDWPLSRFAVNGDTTLRDNLTGLIWAPELETPTLTGTLTCTGGAMNWQAALDYVVCLNLSSYLGQSDWRLPNVNEMDSLGNFGASDNSIWLVDQGFGASPSAHTYWTSTTDADASSPLHAFVVETWGHAVLSLPKTDAHYVHPVRGQTSSGTIALPKTGQTLSFDANGTPQDDGALQEGAAWPGQRFTTLFADINGECASQASDCDGDPDTDMVKDGLTGLIWTLNANIMAVRDSGWDLDGMESDGFVFWQHALDYIAKLNTEGFLGLNDWRLPNARELRSLIDYSRTSRPSLPPGNLFILPATGDWWTSTTGSYNDDAYISGLMGWTGTSVKSTGELYVWPVRSGNIAPAATAEISISKTDNIDPAGVGAKVTYTLTISNPGPDTAKSVFITDSLPAGAAFLPADVTSTVQQQWACKDTGATVECGMGNFPSGSTEYVFIKLTLNNLGLNTNAASVTTTSIDPMMSNNTGLQDTTVITCPSITLTAPPLPDGLQGTPYSQAISASGGVSPYTYTVSTGALPAGLTLDSLTGLLSGTASSSGTSNFTITATDATGCTGSQAYAQNIIAGDVTPPIVSATIPSTGATGVALNSNVTITWDENIDCATVNITNITIDAGGWAFSSCSGNQAVFTTSGLANLTTYTVTVGTAVTDLVGNPMSASYPFSFTTAGGICNWNGGNGNW